MNLKELIKAINIDLSKTAVREEGGGHMPAKLDIMPIEFLMQAEEDYKLGGKSALLNSITNSKRAIACQIDQALMSFGYISFKWNIPKKIEYLMELGLFVPNVLRKISAARNLLEHEYIAPSEKDAQEALDLAALFVYSIAFRFKPFPDNLTLIQYEDEDPTSLDWSSRIGFDMRSEPHRTYYVAYGYIFSKEKGETLVGKAEIDNHEAIFKCIVNTICALEIGYRVQDSIDRLETTLLS